VLASCNAEPHGRHDTAPWWRRFSISDAMWKTLTQPAALLALRDVTPLIADSVIDRARHHYRR
jgi:hypothetical protein